MLQRNPRVVADCLRVSGISVPITIDVLSAYAAARPPRSAAAQCPGLTSQPCRTERPLPGEAR